MDELLARLTDGQIVETLSRLSIMLDGPIQVLAILLLRQQREQGIERGSHVTDEPQMDRRATAELFRPDVNLRDASASLRVKLTIGEIRAQHQQRIAVVHRVIAGRETDEPCDANYIGIVPFHVLLAL